MYSVRATGRPPPARGGRSGPWPPGVRPRKTPACAGRTLAWHLESGESEEAPRLRGEDTAEQAGAVIGGGRPPPARGGRGAPRAHRRGVRKTPACAGRTIGRSGHVVLGGEDPRLRGEDPQGTRPGQEHGGRPPPARGGPMPRPGADRRTRKTPACAGRTPSLGVSMVSRAEDPRLRGEDPLLEGAADTTGGRPPPARGGRFAPVAAEPEHRKTPACAGRTAVPRSARARRQEDPRLRGEDDDFAFANDLVTGRPPPARGGPPGRLVGADGPRKTPACAGRTPARPARSRVPPEDPRLRGEDARATSRLARLIGRPPPARGGPPVDLVDLVARRKTPACAGRTARSGRRGPGAGEDPRLRGEDDLHRGDVAIVGGRPPPARGGPGQARPDDLGQRKTPACAGRTPPPARPRARSTEDPRLRGEDPLGSLSRM